jgi:uroporphyrinogen III methyltransferase/synthase
MKTRKVYLVGAGPGKPDLITVRGLNILKEADVIIYDYLVDKRILENAGNSAELICSDELAGKKHPDGFLMRQDRINNLLVKKAKEGKKVIRLKNGEPSIFGRFSQELGILAKNNIEFEVIPGVTAATAGSSLSGIPLTDRRFASACVFVTGHEDLTKKKSLIDWAGISKSGTVVLYMAVGNLESIVSRFLAAGKSKDTPIAIIQDTSLLTHKVLRGTLKDIIKIAKKEKVKPPAIVIVGEVARLEKNFNWLRKNRRVLFTGLSQERYFIRGTYFHLPLIRITPLDDYKEFDSYLKDIKGFDWIVFASRYAVKYFFERLKATGCDVRALGGIKIAAVGNSTKKSLLDSGIIADLVPKLESAKGLIERFKKIDLRGKRIFLPRSNIADKGLSKALEGLGAKAVSSFAYRNVMPDDLPDLDLGSFDEIMFTSPSTVRNFKKRYKKVPKNVMTKHIGEATFNEAKRCRLLN